MVLESLLNPVKAEKRPWDAFFLGLLYSTIAIFLSLWVFPDQASLISVFLIVLGSVPLVLGTIRLEEKKDLVIESERAILKEHSKALFFLIILFLGFTVAFAFWYTVLPQKTVSLVYSVQERTILSINNRVSGQPVFLFNSFTAILMNNLRVLTFCVLFAFLYGVGAIFILTWNASVVGAAIGNFIRTKLSYYTQSVGALSLGHYFQATTLGLLRYIVHGLPEMLAYFVGGLAGGIISIAIIRHDFRTRKFEKILFDSSELVLLAIVILVIAATIEVYVTPLLF